MNNLEIIYIINQSLWCLLVFWIMYNSIKKKMLCSYNNISEKRTIINKEYICMNLILIYNKKCIKKKIDKIKKIEQECKKKQLIEIEKNFEKEIEKIEKENYNDKKIYRNKKKIEEIELKLYRHKGLESLKKTIKEHLYKKI